MKNNGIKILIGILIILIFIAGGILAYKIVNDKQKNTATVSENISEEMMF